MSLALLWKTPCCIKQLITFWLITVVRSFLPFTWLKRQYCLTAQLIYTLCSLVPALKWLDS
jgi:hypothetical protein